MTKDDHGRISGALIPDTEHTPNGRASTKLLKKVGGHKRCGRRLVTAIKAQPRRCLCQDGREGAGLIPIKQRGVVRNLGGGSCGGFPLEPKDGVRVRHGQGT